MRIACRLPRVNTGNMTTGMNLCTLNTRANEPEFADGRGRFPRVDQGVSGAALRLEYLSDTPFVEAIGNVLLEGT